MSEKENGQRLREIREHLQLSPGSFGRMIYLSKNALIDLEENGLSDGYLKLIEWYLDLDLDADEDIYSGSKASIESSEISISGQIKRHIDMTEREKYDFVYDTINWTRGIVSYMDKYEDDARGISEDFLYDLWYVLKRYTAEDLFYIAFRGKEGFELDSDLYIEGFAAMIYETPETARRMIEGDIVISKQHILLIAFKTGYIDPF